MITTKIWARNISETLCELADTKFQQKYWLEGSKNKFTSFDEAINTLFDDNVFNKFLELPEIKSSADLNTALNEIYQSLENISDEEMCDNKINDGFLVSVKWKKIVQQAGKAKEELDKFIATLP